MYHENMLAEAKGLPLGDGVKQCLKGLRKSNYFLFSLYKKNDLFFQDFSMVSWPILFIFCLKKREKSARSRGVFFVVFPTSDFQIS